MCNGNMCYLQNREGNECILSRDWFSIKRHRLVWQTRRRGVVPSPELSVVQRLTTTCSSSGCASILVLWWKVTGQDIREWHVTFLKEQPHHSSTFEPFAAAVAPGGASSTEMVIAKTMDRLPYICAVRCILHFHVDFREHKQYVIITEGGL